MSVVAGGADGNDLVPVVLMVLSVIAVDESHFTILKAPRFTIDQVTFSTYNCKINANPNNSPLSLTKAKAKRVLAGKKRQFFQQLSAPANKIGAKRSSSERS